MVRTGSSRRAAATAGNAVSLVAVIVAAIIALGIAFVIFDANKANGIVSFVLRVAGDLVGPFKDLFTPKDPKRNVFVNWGLAAVVYLVLGLFVARILRRLA